MKIGDVVYLKSGSPPLLITKFVESFIVTVNWLDDNKIMQETNLPTVCVSLDNAYNNKYWK